MRRFLVVLGILSLVVLVSTAQQPTKRFERVVDRLIDAIRAEDYDAVREDFAGIMHEVLPPERREAYFRNLTRHYGRIRKLGRAQYFPPDHAVFPVHFEHAVMDLKIGLDDQDRIVGLRCVQHVAPIPVPEKHKTRLSLPFKGRWFVFWGGDTKEVNYHHDVPNQRYAFDFAAVNEYGQVRNYRGETNEDYFAFGKQILAPADGVVTDVVDGIRDNSPGSMNSYWAFGNAVLIKHREYEVSVLAHLKLGSITVKVGDRVKRGQVIGLCGNSGNSSEPHLHYHLQNTPIIQDGTGIKCYFEKLSVIDGREKRVEMHVSPEKGDIITTE
jgi:hypothetical protein